LYQGSRVITLAMMDRLHGRPHKTAGHNFHKNKDRLVQGTDYYEVPYVVWSQWDNGSTNFVEPSGNGGRHKGDLVLLIESGYRLVIKSFRDDLAWQVQRKLVAFALCGLALLPAHVDAGYCGVRTSSYTPYDYSCTPDVTTSRTASMLLRADGSWTLPARAFMPGQQRRRGAARPSPIWPSSTTLLAPLDEAVVT
jgi:hypothetical protein